MDITAPLVLKVLGGMIVGGAHRTIAREARSESMGWWVTAMFVPCGSIIYGLRRGQQFIGLVLIMFVGFALIGGGFGWGIYQRIHDAKQIAASKQDTDSDENKSDEEVPEDRPTTQPLPASGPLKPDPTQAALAASVSPADPVSSPASQIPKRLQPKLKKLVERYQQLSADRARLDLRNPDAVRAFNLRAEDYQTACRNFRSELATN